MQPQFSLGSLAVTPAALEILRSSGQDPLRFFQRHQSGDWGVVCSADRQANERAVRDGLRIFSVYRTCSNDEIWVITEADRSSSTLLLPADY